MIENLRVLWGKGKSRWLPLSVASKAEAAGTLPATNDYQLTTANVFT
jgi:hypothetical protein